MTKKRDDDAADDKKAVEGAAGAEGTHPEFAIQRIYVKDISFEAPNAPFVFQQEWKPELNLDINTSSSKLDNDVYEVVLHITVTARSESKVAFLAEVKQAGIFSLKHFTEEQVPPVLGSVCPNIIYPYAREAVSDMVAKGSFPQLNLAPINFDALYQQSEAQRHGQQSGETTQ